MNNLELIRLMEKEDLEIFDLLVAVLSSAGVSEKGLIVGFGISHAAIVEAYNQEFLFCYGNFLEVTQRGKNWLNTRLVLQRKETGKINWQRENII